MPGHALTSGGTLDLGTLRFELGGTAIIKPTSVAPEDLSFMIAATQCKARWTIRPGKEPLVTPLLSAGDYILQVWGKRAAAQAVPFTILGGQQTELVLPTEPGVHQRLDFVYDRDKVHTQGGQITVYRGQTRIVDAWLTTNDKETDWHYDLWLRPGTYRVKMTGKLRGEAELTIGSHEAAPVKIEMR